MDCGRPHPVRGSSSHWGAVSAQRKGGVGVWQWARQAPLAVVGYSGRESENSWVCLLPLRVSLLPSSRGALCLWGATLLLPTSPVKFDCAGLQLHRLPYRAAKIQHLYSPSSTEHSSLPPPPGVDCCFLPPSAGRVSLSSTVEPLALCLFQRQHGQ